MCVLPLILLELHMTGIDINKCRYLQENGSQCQNQQVNEISLIIIKKKSNYPVFALKAPPKEVKLDTNTYS